MKQQKYDLEERLLAFCFDVIRLIECIPKSRAGNHIAGQLLRSGTSPYPNHGEAQAAESAKDFVHKMGVSLKELRETSRWLQLIKRVPLVSDSAKIEPLILECDELIRIFVASIRTAKKRQ